MPYVPIYSTWQVDSWRLLSRTELAAVLADLERKAASSLNTRLNLLIVRLACCCGLRVSEIANLGLGDVRVEDARPHIVIPAGVAKSRRLRRIPLRWDGRNLKVLVDWKRHRVDEEARSDDHYTVSVINRTRGKSLTRQALRQRFRSACKVLGTSRLESLSIHDGRHTFVSHALAAARTLAEVRDAAGHANVVTTSVYLHVTLE